MNSSEINQLLSKRILIAIFVSWIVGSVALIISYFLPTSDVWRAAFNRTSGNGWLIELLRGLMIAMGALVILAQVFPGEASDFIQLRAQKSTTLKWIRLAALVFATAGTCYLVWHHFSDGPQYLANFRQSSSSQPHIYSDKQGYFDHYRLPYLCYLPYSFVNFICFGVPTVAVILYASVKKLIVVNRAKRDLLAMFRDVNFNKDAQEISRQFELFCINLIDLIGSYSGLFLIMTILVAFEYKIGHTTLSPNGLILAWFGYTLACSALLAIFLGFSYYGDAFQQCSRQLIEMGGDASEFESKHGVPKVLNRILIRHLNMYLTLAILLSTFAFLGPLGKLLGLPV